MYVQQSQETGRVQGVVVLATLVLLARDKAEGGRWLESRKKRGEREGKDRKRGENSQAWLCREAKGLP